MKIRHHLDDSTLMSLAAGSLPEALGAVAANHLDWCAQCRERSHEFELIGGAMLEGIEPEAMAADAPDRAWDGLLDARAKSANRPAQIAGSESSARDAALPGPLSKLLDGPLSNVSWSFMAPGVRSHRLFPPGAIKGDLRLLKISPGHKLPQHGHSGSELTLVLTGSYHDEFGRFGPGDVADLDESVEHTPVADDGAACICLIASESPARFKGLISRTLSRLFGM